MWRGRVVATGDDESGFTLVELMVVVVVLGILIAMALPPYLGTRKRAVERAAQSNASFAFETERGLLASTGQVSSDTAGTLPREEPDVHWVADSVPSNAVEHTVAVSVGTTASPNDTVVLGVKANDGTCFYVRNYIGATTQFATDQSCSSATNSLVNGATTPAGGWKTGW